MVKSKISTFSLTIESLEQLEIVAKHHGIPKSQLIRNLVAKEFETVKDTIQENADLL